MSGTEDPKVKVKKLIDDLDGILPTVRTRNDIAAAQARLERWGERAVKILTESVSAQEGQRLYDTIHPGFYVGGGDPLTELGYDVRKYRTVLTTLIEEIEAHPEDFSTETLPSRRPSASATSDKTPGRSNRKVFVVHGHDPSYLETIRILEKELGLEAVVLKEQPSAGVDTIISKFERVASECSAAIVMLTPDDASPDAERKRARQNVIFEYGYFLGMWKEPSARKIIVLHKGDIELPSDVSGVVYISFNKSVEEAFLPIKRQIESWRL